MSNRIKTALITLTAVVLTAIVTFQITSLTLYDRVKATVSTEKTEAETTTSGGEGEGEKTPLAEKIAARLGEINSVYENNYIKEIDEDKLLDALSAAYLDGAGDKYAVYYSPEDFEKFEMEQSGEMVGIGITVNFDYTLGVLEIISVNPGSPADEAGLRSGDMIYSVKGQLVSDLGYYPSVSAMRGEEGTIAEFTVLRPSKNGAYEAIDHSIKREVIVIRSVQARVYEADPTIGIVRLTEFDAETPYQFYEALSGLIEKGANRFIFDVRGNPGGELNSILSVLDMLLPEGPLIRIVDRDGNEQVLSGSEGELNADFAVLINGGTASAAELFSSAVKDYGKGLLVGTPTFGKGTMQMIYRLSDGAAFTISYRMYNPPYSDNYEGVGVQPDVYAEMAEEYADVNLYKLEDSQDTQLQAAISALNNMRYGYRPESTAG